MYDSVSFNGIILEIMYIIWFHPIGYTFVNSVFISGFLWF